MRITLLFLLAMTCVININAQAPTNDECNNAINLGELPYCFNDLFTNANATTSNNANPSCFNGGTSQRDIWFQFQTGTNISVWDISIILEGATDGTNESITNPQVTLYRGDCSGFSEIACLSTENGAQDLRMEVRGLAPGEVYFIQVNDYSLSAAANAGDFRLCIDRLEEPFIIGESDGSTACFGTLFDSGGRDGEYGFSEDFEFVINPAQTGCIEITMVDFQIETFDDFMSVGDVILFFDGVGTGGNIIAQVSGVPNGTDFVIQNDGPITVVFRSDELVSFDGFELTWRCLGDACDGSSVANPTSVPAFPFSGTFSTCEGKASVGQTSCTADLFLFGPDYVFEYNSPGGICAEIAIESEVSGTGVLVLDGLPSDPNTRCVSQSVNGFVVSADLQQAGTYYIIVANGRGCTPFDIQITETDCIPAPSLDNSLCNPLNGCDINNGEPVVFNFIDGFKDIELVDGVNNGCWNNDGIEPDYYWFSMQAQADGAFGFTAQGTDGVSDLDLNVWGPFDPEMVCNDNASIIEFIRQNQPIRSSWSSASPITGLVSVSPITGEEITDDFDCDLAEPSSEGDGFVRPIQARQGEIFVVLLNDWGNEILNAAVEIDWSPSDPGVIDAIAPMLSMGDTTICPGTSTQLVLSPGVGNVQWKGDTNSLSCTNCLNPVATPTETTTYNVVFDAFCYSDSIEVEVRVLELEPLIDRTVCTGETIEVVAGIDFGEEASYSWTIPDGLSASCTDCPNPAITADQAGTYTVVVNLETQDCPSSTSFQIVVLPQAAPEYNISDDVMVCETDNVTLGGDVVQGNSYAWLTDPNDQNTFFSNVFNPVITAEETTTYYLIVDNGICPVPSVDSVTVEVTKLPVLGVANDTTVCQSEPLMLGRTPVENGVEYSWTGPNNITENEDPNLTLINPEFSGIYTLTGDRDGCRSTLTVDVAVIPIAIDILLPDTTFVCKGEEITVKADVQPEGAEFFWTANLAPGDTSRVDSFTVAPKDSIIYYATVLNMGCRKIDSILVVVDSLPQMLAIEPADTTICNSLPVVLRTPAYEPAEFPDITHMWFPEVGQETPDSLFNLVVTPPDTTEYFRVTINNACVDTNRAIINVVMPPPISIIPRDTTVCAGESVEFSIEVPEGKELTDIMWMPEEGALSCTDCPNPVATPISTMQYSVSGEIDDCPVSASAAINVPNDPGFIFQGQTLICPGDSVRLNEVNNPLVTYTWTASPDNGFGTVNEAMPVVAPNETTTYSLVVTRNDVPTCAPFEAQILIEVVNPEDPVLSVTDEEVCENDLVFLEATFESFPGENFLWTDNQGGLVEPRTRVSAAPTTTTIYTFTLDRPGACPDFSGELTVVALPRDTVQRNDITLTAMDNVICEGEMVTLEANVSGFDANEDQATWSVTGGNSIGTGLTVTDSPSEFTSYTFEFLGVDGCNTEVFSSDIDVMIDQKPDVGPDESIEICEGESISLAGPAGQGFNYNWTSTDGSFGGSAAATITATPSQSATYTVNVTSGACPPEPKNFNVNVLESADAIEVGATKTVIRASDEDRSTTIMATVSPPPPNPLPANSVQWFINGAEFPQTGLEFTVSPDSTTIYTVEYQTGGRCGQIVSGSVRIVVINIVIPNAFTPNGQNPTFNIIDIGNSVQEIVTFRVFNRFGQRVYNNENPGLGRGQGWDGNFNGTPQPSDVYAYYIEVLLEDGSIETFQGDVTLVR